MGYELTTEVKQARTKELRTILENKRQNIAALLPPDMTPERLTQIALNAVIRNPDLLACKSSSLALAIIQAAELRLMPNVQGHSYLVPFKDSVTLIIGYKGYMQLAYRSGMVDSIFCDVVRKGEHFKHQSGSDPRIEHIPEGDPKAEVQAYYAGVYLKGSNRPMFVVLTPAEVNVYKTRSRASGVGPWKTDADAMGLKTCFRRLANRLPQIEEFQKAAEIEREHEVGVTQGTYDTYLEGEIAPEPDDANNANDNAKKAIAAKTGKVVDAEPNDDLYRDGPAMDVDTSVFGGEEL